MPIRAQLLSEINAALSGVASSQTTADAHSDIYEAYVFSLVVRAANQEGATISYRDVNGLTPQSLVFRTSPGFIFSTAHPYGFAVIEFSGKPALEAHVGIRVEGRSRVLHECDVAVVYRTEAAMCRANQASPRANKVVLATECKFYSAPVPLGLARGFMGLGGDLATNDRYFVVNTASESAERLLTHHRREWEREIIPTSTNVDRLVGSFRGVFKRFRAKN